MKALLLALALLTITPDALAVGGAWRTRTIVVADHTPDAWQSTVKTVLADFNRVMPKRVPRLVYRNRATVPCERQRKRAWRTGTAIALCAGDSVAVGDTAYAWHRHEIRASRVRIWSGEPALGLPETLCHELMHAVTGMPDDGGVVNQPGSCVWGRATAPGPIDVAFARKVYRKHGAH